MGSQAHGFDITSKMHGNITIHYTSSAVLVVFYFQTFTIREINGHLHKLCLQAKNSEQLQPYY